MALITVIGKAHQVIEQAYVNPRAAIGNTSMPDVESMAALNIIVLNLGGYCEPPLAAGKLRPIKVVNDRRGRLSARIGNLHAGAKASLRHLTLATKLRRRNSHLRPWHNPHADADRLVMQVT